MRQRIVIRKLRKSFDADFMNDNKNNWHSNNSTPLIWIAMWIKKWNNKRHYLEDFNRLFHMKISNNKDRCHNSDANDISIIITKTLTVLWITLKFLINNNMSGLYKKWIRYISREKKPNDNDSICDLVFLIYTSNIFEWHNIFTIIFTLYNAWENLPWILGVE